MNLQNCYFYYFFVMMVIYSKFMIHIHPIKCLNFTFYYEFYLNDEHLHLSFPSFFCCLLVSRNLIYYRIQQAEKFFVFEQNKSFLDFLLYDFEVFEFISCRLFVPLIRLNICLLIFNLGVRIKLELKQLLSKEESFVE